MATKENMQGKEKHPGTHRRRKLQERQELDKYAPHLSPSFCQIGGAEIVARPRIKSFSSRLSCHFALLTARSHGSITNNGCLVVLQT